MADDTLTDDERAELRVLLGDMDDMASALEARECLPSDLDDWERHHVRECLEALQDHASALARSVDEMRDTLEGEG